MKARGRYLRTLRRLRARLRAWAATVPLMAIGGRKGALLVVSGELVPLTRSSASRWARRRARVEWYTLTWRETFVRGLRVAAAESRRTAS